MKDSTLFPDKTRNKSPERWSRGRLGRVHEGRITRWKHCWRSVIRCVPATQSTRAVNLNSYITAPLKTSIASYSRHMRVTGEKLHGAGGKAGDCSNRLELLQEQSAVWWPFIKNNQIFMKHRTGNKISQVNKCCIHVLLRWSVSWFGFESTSSRNVEPMWMLQRRCVVLYCSEHLNNTLILVFACQPRNILT